VAHSYSWLRVKEQGVLPKKNIHIVPRYMVNGDRTAEAKFRNF
jgi:hypothetical protein